MTLIPSSRLYLRAFEYYDLNFLNQLRNDTNLSSKTCGTKYYISSEWDKKWIENKIFNNQSQLYLMICQSENDEPIGYICAIDIDYINRRAQWGASLLPPLILGRDMVQKRQICY